MVLLVTHSLAMSQISPWEHRHQMHEWSEFAASKPNTAAMNFQSEEKRRST